MMMRLTLSSNNQTLTMLWQCGRMAKNPCHAGGEPLVEGHDPWGSMSIGDDEICGDEDDDDAPAVTLS